MIDKENELNESIPQDVAEEKIFKDEEFTKKQKSYAKVVALGDPKQHKIIKQMEKDIHQRLEERTVEDRERKSLFQSDIKVFIQTEKNCQIVAKMKSDDFKVVFPGVKFTQIEVLNVLYKTLPNFERHTEMPSFFPDKFIKDSQEKSEKFTGLRKSTPELKSFGIRALWLSVETSPSGGESFSNLNEKGEYQEFQFDSNSLIVQFEPEIKNPYYFSGDGKTAYSTNKYELGVMDEVPYLAEIQAKLGLFLENLLGKDKVAVLSVYYDGWDIPMTPQDAKKYKNFKQIDSKKSILFRGENIEMETDIIENSEVFSFNTGINEYGILEDRTGSGYLLPYLFTKVKPYSEGLELNRLDKEIFRLRWV